MSKRPGPLNKFAPHGLPAKVITFFLANPDETLTRMDVAEKFSATASSVHTQLKPAVDSGALLRVQGDDGEYVYSPGPAMAAARVATKTERRPPRTPVYVDPANFDALEPEKGVPVPTSREIGGGKWGPLLDKLTEAGTSLSFPIEWHSALMADVAKRNVKNKAAGQPQYLVRKTSPTTSRIWRTK